MTPEARHRIDVHVAAILDASGVPTRRRQDLAEELFGHLAERVAALVAAGVPEADAAARAVADFGPPGRLGRELTRAYRSRLWASTIGVLVPPLAAPADRPSVVGWLRLILGLSVGLEAIGLAIAAANETPVHALMAVVGLGTGMLLGVLAFRALARGQRWALLYAIVVALLFVFSGARDTLFPAVPGSINIPLGAIAAALVLLATVHSWPELRAYVAHSPSLRRAMGASLVAAVALSTLLPAGLAAVPDPTQAGAADAEMRLSMTCDRRDGRDAYGAAIPEMPHMTLVVDLHWHHGDLLPGGLAGAISGLFERVNASPDVTREVGDTAGWRAVGVDTFDYQFDGQESVIDVATGATAGWFGSASPSVNMIPRSEIPGSQTVGVAPEAIRGGHTLRITWQIEGVNQGVDAHPRMEVFYAHLDRFVLEGIVGCGEAVIGHEVPRYAPAVPADGPADWWALP
jgi:hypothetical protein